MTDNKRIFLLTFSLTGGGAEKVAAELSLNLSINNIITLFSMSNQITYPHSTLITFNIHEFNPKFISFINYFIKSIIYYRAYLKKYRPDYSMSYLIIPSMINILSSYKLTKVKKVISLHSVPSQQFKKYYNNIFFKWLLKYFFNLFDKIHTVSEGVKNELISLGINKQKIVVIYNPIDLEKIIQLKTEPLLDEWYDPKEHYIITVGRLSYVKSQWHLIKAFAYVKSQYKCKLIICGEGECRPYFETLIKDLKLQNDILLLGWVENPIKYISKSDVFILTSKYEALPMVLLEAMACGVPVITTDCPYGPREVIDGKYGILTPLMNEELPDNNKLNGSESLLSDKIIQLLTDEKLKRYYSELSLCRALDFSKEKIYALYDLFFEE